MDALCETVTRSKFISGFHTIDFCLSCTHNRDWEVTDKQIGPLALAHVTLHQECCTIFIVTCCSCWCSN